MDLVLRQVHVRQGAQERILPLAVYAALLIFYFAVYAPFGFISLHEGYIFAYGYRIWNGQLPYRDFIYVPPPLSPLIQAAIIALAPINIAFFVSRCYFYFSLFISSFFAARLLDQYFDLPKYGTNRHYLTILAFILSAHNFPPMAWYTVDGIMFATVGMYFMLRRNPHPIIGGISVFLCAMAKQSFYFVPIIALAGCYAVHGRRAFVRGTAGISIGAAAFVVAMSLLGIFGDFLSQTTGGVAQGFKFLVVVKHWVSWPATFFLLLTPLLMHSILPAPVLGIYRYVYECYRKFFVSIVFGTVAVLLFYIPYSGIWNRDNGAWSFWAFLVAAYVSFLRCHREKQGFTVNLCLLGISFAVSLSWGYITPILFSAPMVFGVFLFSVEIMETKPVRINNAISVMAVLVGFFVAYQHPAWERPRRELTQDLGRTIERLTFIHSSVRGERRMAELKHLAAKYGPNITVFPEFPLGNFLTKTNTSFRSDLPQDITVNFRVEEFIGSLKKADPIVFVSQEYQDGNREVAVFECQTKVTVCRYVVEKWERLEAGRFFHVYRQPPLP